MSAENRAENASLRNALSSIQCVRDRVRDGESNETDGVFNLKNFWDALSQAVTAVSQEATKLSVAFSKPPPPTQQDTEKFSELILKSVLTLSTVYYWLPKSQGVTLRRQVRDATFAVLNEVAQLLEVILSSPLQSLTQEQLTSTGSVWSAGDQFEGLPRDNKAAVLVVLSAQTGVVKDAIEEMEQALLEPLDAFSGVLDAEGAEPRGNEDSYWSEQDRRVIGPCVGLMKAAAAAMRKLTTAVRTNGDAETNQNREQLDDLSDIISDISPSVDDLALCLYPPMDYSTVETQASALAALLKKVLGIIRCSHVCGESQRSWVEFLDGAVDHNLQRTRELIQER